MSSFNLEYFPAAGSAAVGSGGQSQGWVLCDQVLHELLRLLHHTDTGEPGKCLMMSEKLIQN